MEERMQTLASGADTRTVEGRGIGVSSGEVVELQYLKPCWHAPER